MVFTWASKTPNKLSKRDPVTGASPYGVEHPRLKLAHPQMVSNTTPVNVPIEVRLCENSLLRYNYIFSLRARAMSGFIEGEDRTQATLFPERIDDYIAEENAVRVIDVFVDELDLSGLGFKVVPEATGRPGYNPAIMLKLYIYGYLNRIQSSRRLEREAGRGSDRVAAITANF